MKKKGWGDIVLMVIMALNVVALWYFTWPYWARAAELTPQETLIMLTNAQRVTPLAEDATLDTRAQTRAEFLCRTGQWSHDGWLGSFSGLPYTYAGENLAKGFPDVIAAHIALMASPTHRANILKPQYNRIGVGIACGIEVELFARYN